MIMTADTHKSDDIDDICEKLLNVDLNGKENINSVIKLQSLWRGRKVRKDNNKMEDNMTFDMVNMSIDNYINNLQFVIKMNSNLSNKKIRNDNLPSHITENIVKFAFYKKYKMIPCWDTDKGDLIVNKCALFKRLEIKGFMSISPSSFGPTEEWDWIYFVDARKIRKKHFTIYEIKLSNKNNIWRNIKINKSQTYMDQCMEKRRPRMVFDKIKEQLNDHCNIMFSGHINDLKF
jgi:hypothetical protein